MSLFVSRSDRDEALRAIGIRFRELNEYRGNSPAEVAAMRSALAFTRREAGSLRGKEKRVRLAACKEVERLIGRGERLYGVGLGLPIRERLASLGRKSRPA